jgi:hypothetical protein
VAQPKRLGLPILNDPEFPNGFLLNVTFVWNNSIRFTDWSNDKILAHE